MNSVTRCNRIAGESWLEAHSTPSVRVVAIVLIVLVLPMSTRAAAAATKLADLSTGVSTSGALIDFGAADDQWSVVSTPAGALNAQAKVVQRARESFVNYEPNARWISVDASTADFNAPAGFYTYATAFDLDFANGTNPIISGEYSADNRGISILLNGALVFVGPNAGAGACGGAACEEFKVSTSFVITQDAPFVQGPNTLAIIIENQDFAATNPTSVAVHASLTMEPVPLPPALWLMGSALGGVIAMWRRPAFTRTGGQLSAGLLARR